MAETKRRLTISPNGMLMLDGEELSRHDPRLWGRSGRNVLGVLDQYGDHGSTRHDGRYFYEDGFEEGGEANSGLMRRLMKLRPEVAERVGDRRQLEQAGIGGWSEGINVDDMEYDDEFGVLTNPKNIKRMDPSNDRYDTALMIAATAGIMGPAAMHAMSAMGAPVAAGGEGLGAGAASGAGGGGGAGGFSFEMLPNLAEPGAMNAMNPAFSLEAGGGGLAGLGEAAGGGGGAGGGAGMEGINIPGQMAQIPEPAAMNAMSPAVNAGGGSMLGNAMNAVGGPQGLARLGAAAYGAMGSDGGGGGGNGGSTDAQSIIDQMANANRVDHNTPIGSRRWVKGADGRWTVNDTMSEIEQANFGNVQQLNSGITGMARDRLAQILAQGPRQRYDRPLGT